MDSSVRQMTASTAKTVLALIATLSLVISLFAVVRPVIANHEPPDGPEVSPTAEEFPGGEPICPTGSVGVRFNSPEADNTANVLLPDGSTATVTILSVAGNLLTFEVENGLAAIVKVKGGVSSPGTNDQNVYDYTGFPGGGIAHDDGLTNPGLQGISHVDFCLVPVEASIIVYKTDQTQADVAGAEFTVKDADTVVAGPTATDANGLVCFDGLVVDMEYAVVETAAPDGWLPADPDTQMVTAVQGTCADRAGDEPDAVFTNTLLGSLLVLKIDDGEPGQPLAGAAFQITGPDGFDETATSDANGWFCLDGLVFGAEYTVTETEPPDGFEIGGTNPQSHVIDDAATCEERVSDTPEPDLTFVNTEEQTGSITIHKVIECEECDTRTIGYYFNVADQHEEETNALFDELGGIMADGILFTNVDQVQQYRADDQDGTSDGQNGLSARGQLTLQYLGAVLNVARNGEDCDLAGRVYNNPDSPFDGWTVAEILAEADKAFDGTSTFSDQEIKDALDDINNSSEVEENPLTCEGGSTGTPLEGAKFDVFFDTDESGDFTDGVDEKVGELESGPDGSDTNTGLALGLYFLVETEAPEGCELLTDPIPVELTDEAPDADVIIANECEGGGGEDEFGEITVIKETDEDEPSESFAFSASWDADGFTLMDGGSESSGLIVAGEDYIVTEELTEEQIAAGWSLADIDCGEATVVVEGDTVTITLGADESVVCTFTNEQSDDDGLGGIEVHKVDAAGTPKPGATFELYLDDGDEVFDPEGTGGGGGGGGSTGCEGAANIAAAGDDAIAAAIVADAATLTGASFETVPGGTPNGTAECLSWFATNGTSFGILTSGDVNLADDANAAEDDGADLDGPNIRGDTDFDVTVLKLDLTTPAGANCMRIDFAFYSEEFDEFVGSDYNDAFIAELNTSTWTTNDTAISAPNNFAFDPSGNVISINSTGATAMSLANAAGTTYDGATVLLTAATPVAAGANSLYLSIFDQADEIYDSAVFLDNVRFETVADLATGCVAGAEEVVGGDELLDTQTTGDDGTALFADLEPGTYWLHETEAPEGCEIVEETTMVELTEAMITELAGEPLVVEIENDCEQGGEQPGGGGPPPGEGTQGGNPVPDTATAPSPTGSVPASLLAMLMLGALGAAGYAVRAEARRRR